MSDATRAPAFATPVASVGGAYSQTNPVPPTPAPATLAASDSWNSGVMSAAGVKAIAVAATLSQTGTLTLQRYIDAAGTIAIGAAVTQNMTANTSETVSVNDGVAAASFTVIVHNTSGSTGNLTNVVILTSAV